MKKSEESGDIINYNFFQSFFLYIFNVVGTILYVCVCARVYVCTLNIVA